MLTLGLMEGLFFATILLLVFVTLAEGAPMHRILGPPALIAISLITIGVVNADLSLTANQIAGLVVSGFTGFLLPVIVMRSAWRSMRRLGSESVEAPAVPTHSVAIVIAHPMRHHRLHRRAHRHAA